MMPSAKFGLPLTGVIDNIAANACLSLISVGCVAVGVAEKATYDDPKNWWLAAVIIGAAVFMPATYNFARLAFIRHRQIDAVPRPTGGKISILIARLHGDKHDTIFRTVREGLEQNFGDAIQVGLWPTTVDVNEHSDIRDEDAIGNQRCQELMTSKGYDVVIWGRVKSNEVVALSISSRQGLSSGNTSYRLTDQTLELPTAAVDRLGAVIAMSVLIACNQYLAFRKGDHALTDTLRSKVENLTRVPGNTFSPETRSDIQFALGLTLMPDAIRSVDFEQIQSAVFAFRSAMAQISGVAGSELRHARIAGSLCEALSVLAGGNLRFADEAEQIAAHALEGLREERQASLRGQLHFAIGLAHAVKFEAVGSRKFFEKAIDSFEMAKTFWTREAFAPAWAVIENNRANILRFAHERFGDGAALDDAEHAARNAIEVWSRDVYPIDWAFAQYNLGTILLRMGERSNDSFHLHASVRAFDSCLLERSKEDVPVDWAKTMISRGNALTVLARVVSDLKLYEKAKSSMQEAIAVLLASEHNKEALDGYVSLIATLLTAAERNTLHSGDLVEALKHCNEALKISAGLKDERTTAKISGFGYYAESLLAWRRRDLSSLQKYELKFQAGVDLCRRVNDSSTAEYYQRAAVCVRTWRDSLAS